LGISRFDFARTTTNIAAASAGSAAFIAVTEWNTRDGFFARVKTRKAGGRSLAVALRTQCFLWHLLTLKIFLPAMATLASVSAVP
jgi:hypothetical protein